MKRIRLLLMGAVLAQLALLPGSAPSQAPGDDPQQNRKLLEEWRKDPEKMARLQNSYALFRSLPGDEQARLRRLDDELHDLDSVNHARLLRVLERYAEWMQRLPAADRQYVESAADTKERLKRVQELKDKQWLDRQPTKLREAVRALPPPEQAKSISRRKLEERQQRDEWRVASRHWEDLIQKRSLPSRLADFERMLPKGPDNIVFFVNEQLMPMLSNEEKDRLQRAEGHWPLYPITLVELVDKHPIQLPGPTDGPKTYADMKSTFAQDLKGRFNKADKDKIASLEGKWPEYAIEFLKIVNQTKRGQPELKALTFPRTVAPTHFQDFPQPQLNFTRNRLMGPQSVLTDAEKKRLIKAEGQWPLYPKTVLELANEHRLTIPGMTLPGPREFWDKYRALPPIDAAVLPEPPETSLRDFFRGEFVRSDQEMHTYSLADPYRLEWVKQEYFRKHPKELEKLRKADEIKKRKKEPAKE